LLTGSNFNIEYLKNPASDSTLVIFTFNPEKELYAADYFLNALEENNLSYNIVLNPVFPGKQSGRPSNNSFLHF